MSTNFTSSACDEREDFLGCGEHRSSSSARPAGPRGPGALSPVIARPSRPGTTARVGGPSFPAVSPLFRSRFVRCGRPAAPGRPAPWPVTVGRMSQPPPPQPEAGPGASPTRLTRADLGSWLSGPGSVQPPTRPDGTAWAYPGERLGLPEQGAGSVARFGRRFAALVHRLARGAAAGPAVLPGPGVRVAGVVVRDPGRVRRRGGAVHVAGRRPRSASDCSACRSYASAAARAARACCALSAGRSCCAWRSRR